MKTNIRSLVLVICCWSLPGAQALRPRRPFALGEKAAQPHHLPATSFDVRVKCKTGVVDRVEADKHPGFVWNSISIRNKVLGIRGGASAVGVITSPAFWLVAAMFVLRVMGESVPYPKLFEGVLTVALIGYFFLLLTKWQENVQAANAD